jgi:glycosyltransferase involved in cell wall biosynthesis
MSRRALLVSQPTDGGCALCVRDLALAAAASGWRVQVATPGGDLERWLAGTEVEVVRVAMHRAPRPAGDLRALRALRGLMRNADLVHLHSSKAGALGRAARLTLRRPPPCLFTPHGWSWSVGGRAASVYLGLERLLAPLADAIVAVSEEEAEEGRELLGSRARRRLVTIPNGVDARRFTPEGPVAAKPAKPLVVFLGRLDVAKGPDLAIETLARLRHPAVLRIVGDGPMSGELAAQARTRGLADRVELIGFSPEPAAHLRASDVVVIPSRWEGMSLSMLEAFACGAPVVMTDVRGAGAARGVARIVPPGDLDTLAAEVDALLDDPAEARAMGQLARARVVADYELKDRLEEVLAAWHRIAA